MYSITYSLSGTTYTIYHPLLVDDGYMVSEASAHLAVNAAGSFSMTMQHDHPSLQNIQRMRGVVEVLDDSLPIFRGRIVLDSAAMYLSRAVECEGMLACLNDSIVPPYNFPEDFETDPDYITASTNGNVVQFWLGKLLASHNSQVGPEQQLYLGNVTVSDPNNYISRSNDSFSTTWETIMDKMVNSALDGYLLIRYESDGNYVDYVADLPLTNVQTVEFAENLLDLNTEVDGTDVCTAILPVGKDGLTMAELPDGDVTHDIVKSGYIVYSRSAEVSQGGRITKVMTMDEVTLPENLRTKAAAALAGTSLPESIQCQACDLHCIDKTIPSFRVGRYIRVESLPHNISGLYPLLEIDLDILDPGRTPIVLNRQTMTLTRSITEYRPQNGKDGNDGTGVSAIALQYILSTSDIEVIPDVLSVWQEAIPTIISGTYLWSRQKITYSDGQISYTDPICVSKATSEAVNPALTEMRETFQESFTSIAQNTESIVLEAMSRYVETGDYDAFVDEMHAALSVMSDQIAMNLTQTTTRIEDVNGDLQEFYDSITKYFRFTTDGLIIGESGNEVVMHIDNDLLEILRNNFPQLWLDEYGANMDALHVNTIYIGRFTISADGDVLTLN